MQETNSIPDLPYEVALSLINRIQNSFEQPFAEKIVQLTSDHIQACEVPESRYCDAIFVVTVLNSAFSYTFTDATTACLLDVVCDFLENTETANDSNMIWLKTLLGHLLESLCFANKSLLHRNYHRTREWIQQNTSKLTLFSYCEQSETFYDQLTKTFGLARSTTQHQAKPHISILLKDLVSENIQKLASQLLGNILLTLKSYKDDEKLEETHRSTMLLYTTVYYFKVRYSTIDDTDRTNALDVQPILLNISSKTGFVENQDAQFLATWERRWDELDRKDHGFEEKQLFDECRKHLRKSCIAHFKMVPSHKSQDKTSTKFSTDTFWTELGKTFSAENILMLKRISETLIKKYSFDQSDNECQVGATLMVVLSFCLFNEANSDVVLVIFQVCWRYLELTVSSESTFVRWFHITVAYLLESIFLTREDIVVENVPGFKKWLTSNREIITKVISCAPLAGLIEIIAELCSTNVALTELVSWKDDEIEVLHHPSASNANGMLIEVVRIMLAENNEYLRDSGDTVKAVAVAFLLIIHHSSHRLNRLDSKYLESTAICIRHRLSQANLNDLFERVQTVWQKRFTNLDSARGNLGDSFFENKKPIDDGQSEVDALVNLCEKLASEFPAKSRETSPKMKNVEQGKCKRAVLEKAEAQTQQQLVPGAEGGSEASTPKLGTNAAKKKFMSALKAVQSFVMIDDGDLSFKSMSSEFYINVGRETYPEVMKLINANIDTFGVQQDAKICRAAVFLFTVIAYRFSYELRGHVYLFAVKRSWRLIVMSANSEDHQVQWFRALIAHLISAFRIIFKQGSCRDKMLAWIEKHKEQFKEHAFCSQLRDFIKFLCNEYKIEISEWKEQEWKINQNDELRKVACENNEKVRNILREWFKEGGEITKEEKRTTRILSIASLLCTSAMLVSAFGETGEDVWKEYREWLASVRKHLENFKAATEHLGLKVIWQSSCLAIEGLKSEYEEFFKDIPADSKTN